MSSERSVTWSDGVGSRGRHPFLLLIQGDTITMFRRESTPGTVVVRGTDHQKNGKWSHTTFRLELAHGVRAISGRDGWETGRFVEGLRSAVGFDKPIDTWVDVANAMGVSVPCAMQFLRAWRPKAAEALDQVDAQLEALDAAVNNDAVVDTETIVVSFGGPTNRAITDGFWKNPKSIPGHDGELRLIEPEQGWSRENIKVAGMVGTVLSATHATGYHGGYVSVTVAVVPGTSFHELEPKVPISAEEAAERTRLKDLLAWENYGSTPLQENLVLAQQIDAFVKEALAARGSQTLSLLRVEANEAYGRASRTAAITEKFPGVSHHALDWAAGRDIIPVMFWAEKLSTTAPSSANAPKVSSAGATLTDLAERWGSGRR